MATIIAPNRSYTGNQGAISFANGVATYVTFEDPEKEKMVHAILKKRGFTIMSDEEYAEKMVSTVKDSAKEGKPFQATLTGDDLLPPVEGEEDDDDMGDDNDDVDGGADKTTPTGKSTTTIKRNKNKGSK